MSKTTVSSANRRTRSIGTTLLKSLDRLKSATAGLGFLPPVTHVYRPLEYAWSAQVEFIEKFAGLGARCLLVGMNPGPWGMAQTGIPFGEVASVRDWLGIRSGVQPPRNQHPRRPILGFDCRRSEISGARLWGWARSRFNLPTAFFRSFMLLNYCPLSFMEASGRNRTPDKLPAVERDPLFATCDECLREWVTTLAPSHVIGVGAFAESRCRAALAGEQSGITLGRIPHPSPASPAANRGWDRQADAALRKLGIASGCR